MNHTFIVVQLLQRQQYALVYSCTVNHIGNRYCVSTDHRLSISFRIEHCLAIQFDTLYSRVSRFIHLDIHSVYRLQALKYTNR